MLAMALSFDPFPLPVQIDHFLAPESEIQISKQMILPHHPLDWNIPQIRDLNEDTDGSYDDTGVEDTNSLDLERINTAGIRDVLDTVQDDERSPSHEYQQRALIIDVRSFDSEGED